jgi:hypothetical protein
MPCALPMGGGHLQNAGVGLSRRLVIGPLFSGNPHPRALPYTLPTALHMRLNPICTKP